MRLFLTEPAAAAVNCRISLLRIREPARLIYDSGILTQEESVNQMGFYAFYIDAKNPAFQFRGSQACVLTD